jgi:hypothetical protein
MSRPAGWIRLFTIATTVAAALLTGACGSTTPSGPSPVPGTPPQYPSLLGHWGNTRSVLELHYRDAAAASSEGCEANLDFTSQTGGSFSGLLGVKGTGAAEKDCTFGSSFTGDMSADGTITGFRVDRPYVAGDCTPLSDPTFRGTVTSSAILITMTDLAMCRDGSGRMRDTDRTLTISVARRAAAMSAD